MKEGSANQHSKSGLMNEFQARGRRHDEKGGGEGRGKTDGTQPLAGQWHTGKMEGDRAKRSKRGGLVHALKHGL